MKIKIDKKILQIHCPNCGSPVYGFLPTGTKEGEGKCPSCGTQFEWEEQDNTENGGGEERIKFYKPRAIALIGLSPNRTVPPPILELFKGCEGWELGIQSVERNMQERIEAILGPSKDNEFHPFVIKNVNGCEEVELIVRYKSKAKHSNRMDEGK